MICGVQRYYCFQYFRLTLVLIFIRINLVGLKLWNFSHGETPDALYVANLLVILSPPSPSSKKLNK